MAAYRSHYRLFSLHLCLFILVTGLWVFQESLMAAAAPQETASDLVLSEQALLEGDISKAIDLLKGAAKGPDRERSLYRLGGALSAAGRHEDALSPLEDLLKEYPGGPFFHKARFLKARSLEALKRFEEASRIYEEEVTRLLSKERKEEVAHFYIRYAKSLADPKREGGPQYPKAVELYRHALDLEIPGPLDAELRLIIAEVQHKMDQFQEEEKALVEFKKRYPRSNVLDDVEYRLAEARLRMDRLAEARRGFRDLLRSHPKSARVPDAHYGIALSYHMPRPNSDQELALGIKALEDFLAAAPRHKKAPRVHFETGMAYFHRGRYDEAVTAFERLIDRFGDRPDTEELAEARFKMGQALLQQRKFLKALSVLNAFLVQHAAHHLWDDAQRTIVDTEYFWCLDLMRERQYEEARTRLQAFCLKYPLDVRAPDAYFALGALEVEMENHPSAVLEWEKLVSKYPDTPKASEAQFKIGILYETKLNDLEAALKAYEKVKGPFQGEAAQRLARMKNKSLSVTTERAFLSTEKPRVKISTRNVETLSFRAYKVDLRDYFLKHYGAGRVEDLDIDLIKPDQEWESTVESYVEYAEITREENLPFDEEGAYILNASDGERSATVLVLVTDLQMILKSGREDLLVFVENVRTRRPFPGAEILVSDGGKVLFQGTTGEDGVLLKADERLKSAQKISVLAAFGGHYASNEAGIGDIAVAEGLSAKAYLFTDRTVYRPGAEVRLKGFVRDVEKGRYFFEDGAAYTFSLFSPAGAEIMRREVRLDGFGGFDAGIPLDESAPLGPYRFQLRAPAGWSSQYGFSVMEYSEPKAEITIDLSRDVFYPGEEIEGTFKVAYSYGEPAPGSVLRYQYGTGVLLEKETDAKGEVPFKIDSRDFGETGVYVLLAEVPAEGAVARRTLHFSTTGFQLEAEPSRKVILAGETLTVVIQARTPGGDPAKAEAELRVIELVEEQGIVTEREKERIPVAVSGEDGRGVAQVPLADGGRYRFRAAAKDRFGNLITADCEAFVSGEADEVKLRIFTDEAVYDAGTTPEVGVHLRCADSLALLTCEGERIFEYRVLRLGKDMNTIPLDITDALAPNFTFAAAVMDGHRLHTAEADLKVRSSLNVDLTPDQEEALPGGDIGLTVKVTDRNGRPVEGELAVALVDSALLARFPDASTPIHEFFLGRERKGRLKTDSSCTFSYRARVRTIDQVLLEDEARRLQYEAEELFDEDAVVLGIDLRHTEEKSYEAMENIRRALEPAASAEGIWAGEQFRPSDKAKGANLEALGKEVQDRLKSLGYIGGDDARRKGGVFKGRFEGKNVGQIIGARYAETAGFVAGRGRLSSKDLGEEEAPRKRFLETAYWNPAVRTGPDGTTRLTIPLPDNITTWKILARGMSRKTAGGQGEAGLKVRKKLFALLEAPTRLVEGDRALLKARVVNGSENEVSAFVILKLKGEADPGELRREARIAAGAEASMDFEILAKDPGSIEAELTARAGSLSDVMRDFIEVVPFGVAVSTGANGTGEGPAKVKLSLPADRSYRHRSMEILVGPSYSDYLLHLSSGKDPRCTLPTNEDTAGRLLVMLSTLDYQRRTGRGDEIQRSHLTVRIEQTLATLLLNQDNSGGFPWLRGKGESPLATGQALKAMAYAGRLGFEVPEKNLVSCRDWIKNRQRTLPESAKIYCLLALSFSEAPDFTELNRFYRIRNQLGNNDAAMLALAFLGGGHKNQAIALADLLLERKIFAVTANGKGRMGSPERPGGETPWLEDELLTLAHAVRALAFTRPGHPDIQKGAEALMKELASGWHASQAVAAAGVALSEYLAGASLATARYRLDIRVNGRSLKTFNVDGPAAVESLMVPGNALQAGENFVEFNYDGRGAFTYAVRLTGFTPDIKKMPYNAEHPVHVSRSYFWAPLTYKGTEIPAGFNTVDLREGDRTWKNELTELNEGETGIVRLYTDLYRGMHRTHAMAVTDTLPAGCTVIESGIQGNHTHYEIGDGTITFYINQGEVSVHYPIYGAYTGRYRTPPPVVRSLYDYDLSAHGEGFDLALHPRGTAKTKAYRMTPDEHYRFGLRLFEDGNLAAAREHLSEFMSRFTPRENYLIDAATKLFKIAFDEGDDQGLIRYFELLRERAPSLTLSFMETARVAASYRNAGEHEQALQLLSMIAGASFSRESKVAEALEKQEEYEGAIEYMADLIRTYPDLPTVQTALFALSQTVMDKAGAPGGKPRIPGRTRKEILVKAIRLLKDFMITFPENPVSDQAAYSLISTYLDLELGHEVARLTPLFRKRWPESKLRRSMEYAEAFALFETGKYEGAQDLLTRVADRSTRGLTPAEKDDRDLARYILGQIEHALGSIEAALERYTQVKGKFEDAAEAIAYFTRKNVSLPEVSAFRTGSPVSLDLTFRNVPEVKLSVYKVDLMKLYLARKSLNAVTDINLAGIRPILAEEIKLGEGRDYRDMKKRIELPMEERGAYLLVVQGKEAGCSGMVLISDLELEVQEDAASGRVRVNVKDAKTREFQKNVYVKVIGSRNEAFQGGYTDLRGIFVSENISGTSAVIAEREGEYAFHRGKVELQPQVAQGRKAGVPQQGVAPAAGEQSRLRALQNVYDLNRSMQQEGQQLLNKIYQQADEGVNIK